MNITLYTQPDCPPCQVVKQFLTHYKITYKEIDISQDSHARDFLVHELQSYSTPTVTVDEEIVKGFDLSKLQQLLGIEE
ncbi:Glutaredoxin-like protein NrdH [Bacillus sp. THAF10]|uniref:glutaredoxin domain-containing protein n=1 Tax=Bacillus sp. THAF10 TaxID=2587848 RepID=UPI0012678AF4|nr:glutaredoxin domain-containing protein [Bacillus sp. THAF10]QFT88676.1 Glutaredoxin-like protein NrdH [Bacillus sp. THAF10]